MRCSRVALSLLLTVLGGAVLALAPTDGRRGVAADIGSAPPAYFNSAREVDEYQGSYDWGDDDYGYVYSQAEGKYGDEPASSDQMTTDEDAYTNDQSEARQYDFEDEYGDEAHQYTDYSASDQGDNEYIYNDYDYDYDYDYKDYDYDYDYDYGHDDEGYYDYTSDDYTADYDYDTNTNAAYEYDADESVYGRESYGYPEEEYTADQDFGYSPVVENEAADEMDAAEMDAEAYDEIYGGSYDEVDDETYSEMYDNEVDDGMYDQADDETADEINDYSYEYAYPESRYGNSRGMDEYFEEEIDPDRGTEDSSSSDYDSDDYSYYDEFGHDRGDWGQTVDEAEGSWTKDDVDADREDADTASTDANPTETHFGQYECWDSMPSEVSEDSLEDGAADYEYSYPQECYGNCYIEPMSVTPRKQGLELFAWGPAELLLATDREMLMSLERLCEEPSGTRRAALNEHIECCGMEAIDFATRFEDTTGSEVLGLADDLPGCAAFMATFRLLERGELNVDEAVDLFSRSLTGLSQEWIEGVSEITADAFDNSAENWPPTASVNNPLFSTVISMAAESLNDLGGAICSLSRRLDTLRGRF